MNYFTLTVRLISAIAAAITLLLLVAVLAIAEPKRSVLIAKIHGLDDPMPQPTALTVASLESAKIRK